MNIPIYRAKRLDNGEYVEGFYCEHKFLDGEIQQRKIYSSDIDDFEKISGQGYVFSPCIKLGRSECYIPIDPSTLWISFDDGLNWWKDLKMINDHLKRDLCSTMSRPKKECGCPDCGSSLIG